MGWFDGPKSHHSSSIHNNHYVRRRQVSPSRKSDYLSTHHARHSAPSIFSFGRGPSVFSSFSSSSRRARPRDGFMQRMVRSIKKLFRDIYRYARKNPIKVFLLVIIPLLTSGILPKLLAMIGVRLPHGIHTALGGSAGPGARAMGGGMENKGLSDSVNSLVSIAKMFA
ncbi:hypothetical protein N7470_005625 [Penicillium chermesinum]|nr:hypothetical protein N7470_005625 [Penicillium chermesinum]